MMSHSLRKFIYRLILISFCIYVNSSMAMTIQGKIKDGSIKWNNAIRQDRYLTLSNWQIISGLYPTKEWKPGSFISVGGIKDGFITLSNGSSSVSIPFKVAGTQYRLGDAASKFAIQKSTGATFKVCKEHALNKNQAVVIGDEPCVSKEEYKSEIAYTPFHFVRPLLEVDDNKIKEAFSESSLTKGIYTGSVTITPMYMFKSPSGSWTYRTSSPIPLNISINYPGSQILDFEVIGDGIIHPFYNIEPRTISGLTKYQVKFRGVFSEGSKINMKLLKPTSGKFQLLADNESIPEGKDKIPYSIKCKGDSCGDDFFVNFNGNMILDGGLSYLRTPKGGTNEISIDLEVAYKNIPKSSVDTGRYSNSFTIIFENEM